MKRTRNAAVLSLLLCMVAAALPEIETSLGRLTTMHLAKLHDPGETETEVWLSPAHSHLPVKMRVIESDGARYEQTITRLEVRL